METTYTLTETQLRMFATTVCARYFTSLNEETGTTITASSVRCGATVAAELVDKLELEPYMWDMDAMATKIKEVYAAQSKASSEEVVLPPAVAAALKKLLNA